MRKERAQAIMETIEKEVSDKLSKWKPTNRYFNGSRLQVGWHYKHTYLSIVIHYREYKEGISVTINGPDGVTQRDWRGMSAEIGEKAIEKSINFAKDIEEDDDHEILSSR